MADLKYKQVFSKAGDSLIDIALREYGYKNGKWLLLEDNPDVLNSVTDEPEANTVLNIRIIPEADRIKQVDYARRGKEWQLIRVTNNIYTGGSPTFLGLTDTPSSYSGSNLKYVRVKGDGTGLEFAEAGITDLDDFTTDDLAEGSTNLYYTNARADARITAQKGVANGIASLDSGGKVPTSQLPAIAITDVYVVADIAARDALTVQKGDVAKVTDAGSGTPANYIYDGSAWIQLADNAPVYSVNGQAGAVNLTTTNIAEGTNLYYTNARVAIYGDAHYYPLSSNPAGYLVEADLDRDRIVSPDSSYSMVIDNSGFVTTPSKITAYTLTTNVDSHTDDSFLYFGNSAYVTDGDSADGDAFKLVVYDADSNYSKLLICPGVINSRAFEYTNANDNLGVNSSTTLVYDGAGTWVYDISRDTDIVQFRVGYLGIYEKIGTGGNENILVHTYNGLGISSFGTSLTTAKNTNLKIGYHNGTTISNGNVIKVSDDIGGGRYLYIGDDPGLGTGGGAEAFTDLTDVPSAYTSAGLKYVRVNETADGLEFATFPSIPSQFRDLTDVPSDYTGHGLKLVRVNVGETGLEFFSAPYELTANKDTDTTLAANSDTKYPSQKAVKTYIDSLLAASDAVIYKGATDCSGNPNYPAADAGHLYIVSVAGKIGGAAGIDVEAGDMFICKTDGTVTGNHATVGAYWNIIQTNIYAFTGTGAYVKETSPTLITPNLGTPSAGDLSNCTFPTLNQNTTGSAVYWKTAGTGKAAISGPAVGATRTYTFPDADATILYNGGALGTPTSGTLTNCTFPTLNQDTTGSAVYWKTAGTGKAAITGPAVGATRTYTFPNADATILYDGGALGTPASGTLTNCTFPTLNQDTTGSAVYWKTSGTGKGAITGPATGTTRTYTFPDADATIARTDAAQTFTGVQTITNITFPTNGQLKLTVPTTDGHATGFTTNAYNSGYSSSAIGDLVYLDSSNTWQKCDADASSTTYSGLLGIALAVAASGAALLVALPGSFVYTTNWSGFTVGGIVFMSATAGAITQTAPTTTDSATRKIGWAVASNKIYFMPSNDFYTHT